MNRWKRWLARLLFAVLFLTSCNVSDGGGAKLPVVLTENENITILSENPVGVTSGGDAVFQVEVMPGYVVRESESYAYADGYITVKNVLYPTTVTVDLEFNSDAWLTIEPSQIPQGKAYTFSCRSENAAYGTVNSSLASGTQPSASHILLTAVPTDTGRFVCWTVGAPLSGGGTPFSTTEECSFYLSMDTTIYANFANKESATLIYDANGGQTKDGGRYLRHDSPTDFYFYPHALANQGQLTRDGYVLYAYNTKPDGSGTQYTFGANVVTPANGTLMLYAQWLRADPAQFEYRTVGGEIYIKGCTSTDEWVVVPETIEGKPVTTLETKAFDGLTNMTTLVLNPSIQWVNDGAVYNCPNFTTLYLCDNVRRIPDSFHLKCPEFQTLHLGAALAPSRMDQRGGTFHIKFQRLLKAKAEGLDAVIIVAGSSSGYGFISEVFEKEMNYEYYPVNLATTIQISALYLLEAFKDFVDEGDILIQAPETTSKTQVGGNAFVSYYWNCYEGVPELLSHVDLRNYTGTFSTLTQFNENRAKMNPTSYSDHNEVINRYGEYLTVRDNPSPDYASLKDRNLPTSNLTEKNAARLNLAYANLEAAGARVYFSFAPLNVNSFSEKAKTDAVQNAYQKRFESLLKIPVISHFSDYVMEGKYFYDSDYHLTNEGAEIRTKQLAADLKAQLEKEAKEN